MTASIGNIAVHRELMLGRRELSARFRVSPPRTLRAGELLTGAACSSNVIYHIVAGWACQFQDYSNNHQTIAEIYTPGDVIGIDAVLRARTPEKVMTLTSVTIEVIDAEGALLDLMSSRSTALYVAWLFSRRQRRSERRLAAIASLDAQGQLATMLLDFYKRLSSQRLITASSYTLPLTQIQIAAYLGLTVAHVNRVLRLLREERIANFEKHCVTILDLGRLTRLTLNAARANSAAGPDQLQTNPRAPELSLTSNI